MKIKTADLTGALLDYWVARAEGLEVKSMPKDQRYAPAASHMIPCAPDERHEYAWHGVGYRFIPRFSRDWAQSGPIIERERISVQHDGYSWDAKIGDHTTLWSGYDHGTPLIAAMRTYVARKFGEEVEESA